ncbi:MAG: cobalamin biosynthesis protein [Chloroflexota bacterium]
MLEAGMLIAALLLDLAFGEPPTTYHPVGWMGRLVAALERPPIRDVKLQLGYGAAMVMVGVLVFVGPAWLLLGHLRQTSPLAYFVLGTLLLKSTFSVKALFEAAESVRRSLLEGRLDRARAGLRSLASRDATQLGEPEVVAATVESVAENSSDSFVAPVFYFLLFGVPGALAYRVVNTFDAMVGYHGRYEYLGKPAARLDDLANLIPARLTGLLLVAASFLTAFSGRESWRTMWRYHAVTESPNAGWPMSAMAGALSVQLEKIGHYRLGDGAAPLTQATIAEGIKLSAVGLGLAVSIIALGLVLKDGHLP